MKKIDKFTITMLLIAIILMGLRMLFTNTEVQLNIGFICLCIGTGFYIYSLKLKD